MRIMGVDPGTWHTGVGIVETQGSRYQLVHVETVNMRRGMEITGRLMEIHRALLEMLRIYRPAIVALEDIFFGKDPRAMVRIGEARACVMLAAAESGVEVIEYSATRIKQSVSGSGRATKEQVQHMVKTLLGLKAAPSADSADALAIALCHAHRAGTRRLEKLTSAALKETV